MADVASVLSRETVSLREQCPQRLAVEAEEEGSVFEIPDAFTQIGILDRNALVKIDRVVALDGLAIVTGWRTQAADMSISGTRFWMNYRRSDVEEQFGLASAGFTAVVQMEQSPWIDIHLAASGKSFKTSVKPSQAADAINTVLVEQKPRLHNLVPALSASKKWGEGLALLICDAQTRYAKGHIDMALWIEGAGVAVSGWAISADPSSLYIVTEDGLWLSLTTAEPVYRQDVIDAYAAEFGHLITEPGFYTCVHGEIDLEENLFIVSVQEDGFFRLFKRKLEKARPDPVEFARYILSERTPAYRFAERVERHDLRLIEALLKRKTMELAKLPVDRWDYGRIPTAPIASVIVPLYGRWDFVEHQLLEFCNDSNFVEDIELIYVIDDPSIVSVFLMKAQELYDLYEVPFSILWGRSNRGYSGANNLGAQAAQGRTLIFLNSDAFPNHPGWVPELVKQLDQNPNFGVIAPRLLFADGGLQHVGIRFRYDGAHRVWLNDHPLLGLPPEADDANTLVERPAVTGACMAVRYEQFIALGGFDTGYLIGDFEDSDLCLKYRTAGLLPGYYPGIEFTHLERQSFRCIGNPDFRQLVVIFNAVRHTDRWRPLIERLEAFQTKGVA